MANIATSIRSWLQRAAWSRQRVQDVVSLLRFDQLPPSHERSPRSASKLKNLVVTAERDDSIAANCQSW